MKNKEFYYNLFINNLKELKKASGYSEYGSRVMPLLKEYKKINDFNERRAFQDALELLLRDDSDENRNFGIDICLGFFVFRDAI